jgi:hypothetical protein
MDVRSIMDARKRWREQVIEAFGESSPLLFDINTAPEGILRLISASAKNSASLAKGQPYASREALLIAVPNSFCLSHR